MQLKSTSVRHALAVASCALLGGHAAASETRVDASVLFYSEQDRVNVVEPVLFVTQENGEDDKTTWRLVYDALSGASPNGAVPTATVQTFTGASGKGGYTTPPYEQPKRDFNDTRVAVGADFDRRVSPTLRRAGSVNLSKEEDYISLGGNLTFARDFNQKLTTVALGGGISLDQVQPHGGAPTELMPLSTAGTLTAVNGTAITAATLTSASGSTGDPGQEDDNNEGGSEDDGEGFLNGETKVTGDLLVGVTQVLSRRTLMQLNLSHSRSSGYLTDPYKIVSLVDAATGQTVDYVFEKRPSQRAASSAFTQLAHHFDRDVVHVSYRYFMDDWDIRSHTVELAYRWKPSERFYLEPQYRWYHQTAADFFHYFLVQGETVSAASADLRLAEMTSTTTGIKLGIRIGDGELDFRAARMHQQGDSHPDEAFGVLTGVDLHPDLDATLYTVGYSGKW